MFYQEKSGNPVVLCYGMLEHFLPVLSVGRSEKQILHFQNVFNSSGHFLGWQCHRFLSCALHTTV
jgi:hypothetical protein